MKEQLWGGRQGSAPQREGEREREQAGRGSGRRETRGLKLPPLTTLSSVLAAAPAGQLVAPSLWIKLCSATWSQLCRSEGPPKFSISLILGAYVLRKKKEFCWDSRYFYLWDGEIARGKRLEQNKSKERKKNNLTRSKAPFGNFKTNALLLLKALIFFSSFKKEPLGKKWSNHAHSNDIVMTVQRLTM